MPIRFSKADRATGVDGHFTEDSARVTVSPSEFPTPLYPEESGYWREFGATIDAVCQARDNARYTRGVSAPLESVITKSAGGAAELVHHDWPTEILTYAAKGVRSSAAVIPGLSGVFTDKVVMLNHLMSWAAHAVSPNSFCAKWHFLVPRPEEVAGAIARDEIDAPESIKCRLYDMVSKDALAKDQRVFTMYSEGSPMHPSYSAMHSAAAGAAAAIVRALFDLSDPDRRMVNLAARNMAFFRTTAGVHTPQDNVTGLWLGETTVKRLLPEKMEREFGVDSAFIESRLIQTGTDWLAA